MSVNLNYQGWQRVARTLASSRGFGLRYVTEDEIERMGAQAWNDGRYAYVRRPQPGWSDKQFRLWLYQLVHEIGHSRASRRACFDVLKDKRPNGLLRFLHNLFEDFVQELDMYEAEPVLRDTLCRGRAEFYEWSIEERERKPEITAGMIENPQGSTVFCWDAALRCNWNPRVGGFDALMRKPIESDPRVAEWTEKLRAGTYGDELLAVPDVWETYEIAERVLREVFEVEPEECQDPEEGEGDGEGDDSDGNDGQGSGGGAGQESQDKANAGAGEGEQGDGESEGAAGGGKSVPKDKPGGPVSKAFARFNYDDLLMHNHQEDARGGNERSGGCAIDYDEYFKRGAAGPRAFVPDLDRLVVYDCTRDEYPEQDMRNANA